ncbi:hypothetical protein Aasi_0842 [Candidatus Amoebophilus asiaticus 5a2]|uniref:Uncharacterized protein n=1 Tax=Amoebophilus asiaticus (strain 5a2) TaxID=452471 RepID=B3ESL1_AMOA5|nr:hypothetical protein [Candidatus Amoebophilus asiaticus]ACE06213.1 hypothetical protein Aasi_0842 [Candidatus Amoebophilus asiaticus 5a2]
MKVKIDDIEKVTSLLLSKLKESKGNEIELNNDFYWDISEEELYNPYQDPKNITLDQLSDDLEEIQRLIKSDDAITYDLKRLASILKALSIENRTAF